jgi:O-antigen/teichoic acid export membrane protein
MLAYSIPLIPASIGSFLNAYADRLAIRTRMTLADVGVYGAGYRLSLIVSIVLVGFQGAMTPLVLSRHEDEDTRAGLATMLRYFAAIALLIFLLISLFADELLHLLTRPAYYAGAKVVPFVVAGAFLGGMYGFAPGLNIAKRTRLLGTIIAATGLLNLALAFALVGPLGVRGPAVAFVVACAAGFAAVMAVSQRVYPVEHSWWRLGIVTATVVGVVVLSRVAFGHEVAVGAIVAKLGLAALGLGFISLLLPRRPLAISRRRRRR